MWALRAAGQNPVASEQRARPIHEYLPKIEQSVAFGVRGWAAHIGASRASTGYRARADNRP